MSHIANILSPIQTGLPSQIWDNPTADEPTLKPHVADFIRHTIYHALETNGYARPKTWLHLVLTGSLTTYQWDSDSDCDVSLFIDSAVFPEWSRAEMIGVMLDHCDGVKVPGSPFPLQDYVVPAHLKPADLYRPGLRSGWDIDQQRWITPPERGRAHDVQAQENGFYVWALEQTDKLERLMRYEPQKAIQMWHQLHERRRRDMAAGKGDFAESNILYKFIANRGYFDQLSKLTGEHIASTNPWKSASVFSVNHQSNGLRKRFASLPAYLDALEEAAAKTAAGEQSVEPEFQEVPGATFHQHFQQALQHPIYGKFLSPYTPEELGQMRTFIHPSGLVGGALHYHPDGRVEAGSLFNNGGPRGSGMRMFDHLVGQGANYLSAIGDDLRQRYEGRGFQVSNTMPWDDQYAPEGWNYEKWGRPNVYEMQLGQTANPTLDISSPVDTSLTT